MRAHSRAPTLSSRSTARPSRRSRSSSASAGDPWMPPPPAAADDDLLHHDRRHSQHSPYTASQDAGETTAHHGPSRTAAATTTGTTSTAPGGGKHHAIWTPANPLHAKQKRRRSLITSATRALWTCLALAVMSEIMGLYRAVWKPDGGVGSSSHHGGGSTRVGGGRQEYRRAKKKGSATTSTDDPLAGDDDDWQQSSGGNINNINARVAAAAGRGGVAGLGLVGAGGGVVRSVGPDGVQVTTRTTTLGGAGGAGLGIGSYANGIGGSSNLVGGAGGRPYVGCIDGNRVGGSSSLAGGGGAGIGMNLAGQNDNQHHQWGQYQQQQQHPHNTQHAAYGGGAGAGVGADARNGGIYSNSNTNNLGGISQYGAGAREQQQLQAHLPETNHFTAGGGQGGGNDNSDHVRFLEQKIAILEGKLSSLLDDKSNNNAGAKPLDNLGKRGSTDGNIDSTTKQLQPPLENDEDEDNGKKEAVNYNDERKDGRKKKTKKLRGNNNSLLVCERYDGPDDDSDLFEVIYWKDYPQDAPYLSPFHPTRRQVGQRMLAISMARQYLTFEVDGHAGWNRARMQFETMLILAHAMGRTLVLPPKWNLWPHERGLDHYSSFDDFFDLDGLRNKYSGVDIVSMEDFLTKEATTGKLRRNSGGIDAHFNGGALAESVYPPSGKTNWNGDADIGNLWSYLDSVALVPAWDFDQCIAAFPASTEEGADIGNTGLESIMARIVRKADGRPKPSPQHFQGKPTSTTAPAIERLREIMAGREKLCIYDDPMRQANLVHFRVGSSGEEKNAPGHFYSNIFFEEYAHDLWAKRLVRDNLRYNDEIQCAAARVITALREKALSVPSTSGGKGEYDALHLRRTNFRQIHKDAILTPEEIGSAVSDILKKKDGGMTLYVATDSRGDEVDLLSYIENDIHVVSLRDFANVMGGVDTKYFPMIDQIVASRSRTFIGTYYSTFSGYINRLRGYHSAAEQSHLNSVYLAPKSAQQEMQVYKAVRSPFFAREYPVAWRDIDR